MRCFVATQRTLVPLVPRRPILNPVLTIQAANSAYLGRPALGQPGSEGPMAINDLPMLSALRTKMQWHQERQRVLSENVSNSSTPNFRPRDLVEPKFDQSGGRAAATGSLAMIRNSN